MTQQIQTTIAEDTQFDADAYESRCSFCGEQQTFVRENIAIRETYRCSSCKASLREREQAKVLVDFFSRGSLATLQELVLQSSFRTLSLYEPGTTGAFRRYLSGLPNYHQSIYYAEGDRDSASVDIPHQTLESLTYEDRQFDLVLTSDVFEHIRRPMAAFQEIYRVLKPGGLNLLTVPLQEPIRSKTRWRVDTSGDEDVHLLPPHYHGNGRGGRSLVYCDFGTDILEMMREAGFAAGFAHPHSPSPVANKIVTVVGIRPSA